MNREYLAPQIRRMNNRFHLEPKLNVGHMTIPYSQSYCNK